MSDTIYYYKDKPYKILYKTKMKLSGLFRIFKYDFELVPKRLMTMDEDDWIHVVIYECQYENSEGQVWVRENDEFFQKFKPKD